jgi:hypothetical protein
MNYIKGLKNFYHYEYNHVNYYFLGDVHLKLPDPCPQHQDCDHMVNNFTELLKYNQHCSNVTALIYQWLTFNFDNQITTNFYIEYPIKTDTLKHQYSEDNNGSTSYSNKGFMVDTMIMLKDCLHSKCIYNPIVKIHRVDPRQTVLNGVNYISSPFLLDDFENMFITVRNMMYKKLEDKNQPIDNLLDMIHVRLNEFVKLIYFLIKESNDLLEASLGNINFSAYIGTLVRKLPSLLPGDSLIRKKILTNITKMLTMIKNNHEYIIASQLLTLSETLKSQIVTYALRKNKQYVSQLLSPNLDENYEYNEYSMLKDLEILKNWNKQLDTYDQVLDSISSIVAKMVLLSSIYMDTYTLGRMFKYENDEVIIYAGKSHIDYYAGFFDYIYGKRISGYESKNTCIAIKSEKINMILS